jgi:diguanylate cyclase (GGDEF)-like protein/PAS domain S-box-containing protein
MTDFHQIYHHILEVLNRSCDPSNDSYAMLERVPAGVLLHQQNGQVVHLNSIAEQWLAPHFLTRHAINTWFQHLNLDGATVKLFPKRQELSKTVMSWYEQLKLDWLSEGLLDKDSEPTGTIITSPLRSVLIQWGDRQIICQVHVIAPAAAATLPDSLQLLVLHPPSLPCPILPKTTADLLNLEEKRLLAPPSPLETATTLFQKAPVGLYTLVRHAHGTLTLESLNSWFVPIYGAAIADLMQSPRHFLFRAMTSEERGQFWRAIAPCLKQGKPLNSEWQTQLPGSEVRWLQTIAQPETQSDGSVVWYGIVLDVSDHKVGTRARQEQAAQYQTLISALPDLMFRISHDGIWLGYVHNNACIDFLPAGYDPIGQHISEHMPSDIAIHQLAMIDQALTTGQMQVFEQTLTINGRLQHEEVRIVPHTADEVLFIVRDISDRKQAELDLQAREAENRAIIAAMPDLMLWLRRDGTLLKAWGDERVSDLFGYSSQWVVGRTLQEMATTDFLKRHVEKKLKAIQRALDSEEVQIYEQEVLIGDKLQHEEVRIVPSGSDEVLVMIRDIGDRHRMESALRLANERLEKLALTDALTGLANRRSLDEHLRREWRRAIRERTSIAFILFDLDYFKRFNDTYGHQVGDQCLVQVSQGASKVVNRSTDLVARYGGEEFAVVLESTDLQGAYQIAERIRQTVLQLNIPHSSSLVSNYVTASLGVSAVTPVLGSSPNEVIRQADHALYAAKKAGRNNCQCYIHFQEVADC